MILSLLLGVKTDGIEERNKLNKEENDLCTSNKESITNET